MGYCCSKDTHLYIDEGNDNKTDEKIISPLVLPTKKNEEHKYKTENNNNKSENVKILKSDNNFKLKLEEDNNKESNINNDSDDKNKKEIINKILLLLGEKFNFNSEDLQVSGTPKSELKNKDVVNEDLDYTEKQKYFARKIFKYNSNLNRKKVASYLNKVNSEQNLNLDLEDLNQTQLQNLFNSFNEDVKFIENLNTDLIQILPKKNESKISNDIKNTSLGTETFKELRLKILKENYLIMKNYVYSCRDKHSSNLKHVPSSVYANNQLALNEIVEKMDENKNENFENFLSEETNLRNSFFKFLKIERFLFYLKNNSILLNLNNDEIEKNEQKYSKGYVLENDKENSKTLYNCSKDCEKQNSNFYNENDKNEITDILFKSKNLDEMSFLVDEINKKLNLDFIYDLKSIKTDIGRKTQNVKSKTKILYQKSQNNNLELYEKLQVSNPYLLAIKRMEYYKNLSLKSKNEEDEDDMDKFGSIF